MLSVYSTLAREVCSDQAGRTPQALEAPPQDCFSVLSLGAPCGCLLSLYTDTVQESTCVVNGQSLLDRERGAPPDEPSRARQMSAPRAVPCSREAQQAGGKSQPRGHSAPGQRSKRVPTYYSFAPSYSQCKCSLSPPCDEHSSHNTNPAYQVEAWELGQSTFGSVGMLSKLAEKDFTDRERR